MQSFVLTVAFAKRTVPPSPGGGGSAKHERSEMRAGVG